MKKFFSKKNSASATLNPNTLAEQIFHHNFYKTFFVNSTLMMVLFSWKKINSLY